MRKPQSHVIRQLSDFLERHSETPSDSDFYIELSSLPAMIVNPLASMDSLQNEADLRLGSARDMLSGIAGATPPGLMVQDAQAACAAAAHLIEDAIQMIERANSLAREGGGSL
jgi:hypothetical protein